MLFVSFVRHHCFSLHENRLNLHNQERTQNNLPVYLFDRIASSTSSHFSLLLKIDLMTAKKSNMIQRKTRVGEGGFGVVYFGSYGDHREVGIKDIPLRISDEALDEARMLRGLTHPNIIRYIDIVQERNQTSIIMEFIDGGSLYDYIGRTPQSSSYWRTTRQILIDVAYGMAYLHSHHIVHADLKSLNVLLRHNYNAVICDFGLARTIVDTQTVTTTRVSGKVRNQTKCLIGVAI